MKTPKVNLMALTPLPANFLEERWWLLIKPVLSELASSDDEYTHRQLCSIFWIAMRDSRLDALLDELVEGNQLFIQDEITVDLPKFLISEDDYYGDVIIDLAGSRVAVSLKDLCLVAKLAALFNAKYISPRFNPWEYFVELDQVVLRFELAKST